MKILVAYYSRTGTTKKVAEAISKQLKCDIEEVIDTKDRRGVIGYLSGGRDATLRKLTKIKPIKKNPANYDLVVVGTPIWSWNTIPAIRAYLTENKFKKAAFFCTMGGSGDKRAFEEMEKLSIKPTATLTLTTKEVMNEQYKEKLKDFIKQIQHS